MHGCMTLLGGGKSVLMVKPEGKKQLARPKNRRDNNVKHFNFWWVTNFMYNFFFI